MTNSRPDVGVVIAAGGQGVRAGGNPGHPKQFREIAGVPMLLRSVRPFSSNRRVHEIVVVLPNDVLADPPDWLTKLAGGHLQLVAGGETRAQSVANGVDALSQQCSIVLIHDGARPFVSAQTVDRVIGRATSGSCAIAAIPVSDTLKRSSSDGILVLETVSREFMWHAQTPQGFPRDKLQLAYAFATKLHGPVTDEASLAEAAGLPVEIVPDSPTNLKITTPEDFAIAEAVAAI